MPTPAAPTPLSRLLDSALQLHRQGRLEEAAARYNDVLKRMPGQPDALHYLGVIAFQCGHPEKALKLIDQSLKYQPGNAEAWCNLGAVRHGLGQFEGALTCFREAARLAPSNPQPHSLIGSALLERELLGPAEAPLRTALSLAPAHAPTRANLGLVLQRTGRLTEAEAVLREGLAQPFADLHANLAVTLEQQGRAQEAVEHYAQALHLAPAPAHTGSAFLHCLHNLPGVDAAQILAESRAWAAHHAQQLLPPAPAYRHGRLRIGYVSADLHRHPVAMFLESALAHHDAAQFDIHCFASQRVEDAVTARLKALAHHWHPILPLDDEAAARLIRAQEIDILVDLGGHTGHNRLGIFARRPAPVQASWLGYFGTTGLEAMDFLVADRHVLPEGTEDSCTETVLRLPEYFLCLTPPEEAGDVAPLPALAGAPFTFGSFNRLSKITPEVVALWAQVLHAVPESRLFMKAHGLGDEGVCARYRALFAQHAVPPQRLHFEGHSPLSELYAAYGRVDVALDSFPHNGGATSMQALWCGVPVLALEGSRFSARMGAGILRTAGLADWVADAPEAYAEKARALAADLPALAALRSGLRARLRASPLMDAPAFTRALEALYVEMMETQPPVFP